MGNLSLKGFPASLLMKVKKLTLYNYRNIPSAELTFSGEMNFLLGDNAQGKTNALEAIYLFARGKSFRGATDSELTAFGQSGYAVTLTFEKTDREETLFCSRSNSCSFPGYRCKCCNVY